MLQGFIGEEAATGAGIPSVPLCSLSFRRNAPPLAVRRTCCLARLMHLVTTMDRPTPRDLLPWIVPSIGLKTL
jgi:hypothetical protein